MLSVCLLVLLLATIDSILRTLLDVFRQEKRDSNASACRALFKWLPTSMRAASLTPWATAGRKEGRKEATGARNELRKLPTSVQNSSTLEASMRELVKLALDVNGRSCSQLSTLDLYSLLSFFGCSRNTKSKSGVRA